MDKSNYIAKGIKLIEDRKIFMPNTFKMIKVKFIDGPAKDFSSTDVSIDCLETMTILIYADNPWAKINCIYSIGEQIDGIYQATLKEDRLK